MAGRLSITESTYRTLRARILAGAFAPGARIDANEIAAADGVSPTPVRSALNRLVGAGLLVSHSNEGFFVPICSEQDLRDLYGASAALLGLAISGAGSARKRSKSLMPINSKPEEDVVADTEGVFRAIMGLSANRRLQMVFDDINTRLRSARNIENGLIGNRGAEIRKIRSACRAPDLFELGPLVATYHQRRLRCVTRIVARMTQRESGESYASRAESISK